MVSIDSLHINSVLSFLEGCKKQGISAETIFHDIGLDPALLQQPDARAPAEKAGQLIEAITLALKDETLGFFQRPSRFGSIETALYASIHSKTLGEAFMRFGRFWMLMHDECHFNITTSGEEAKLTIKFSRPEIYSHVSFIVWIVFLFTRWSSWIINQPFIVDRLHLPFTYCHEAEDFPNMFPSRFYFDQPTLEMIFHSRYLETPIKQTAKDVPDFLAIAPNLMTTHRVDNSLTGRIRRMLQNVDNVDALPLKIVAESFGRTPETIRRKLKDEGSSYAEIKESVRHDMAIYLLKKTDTPINQIALNVGFSDSSTFNRAFKKWTGLTPGDYRRDSD